MFDIAIDKATGDWLFNPNLDLRGIRGDDVIKQRIFARLTIQRGWINDPTDGTLGSRLRQALRGDPARARNEVSLYVDEALAPMPDVRVEDIQVRELSPTSMLLTVIYTALDPGDPRTVEGQAAESVTVEIPI